MFPTINRFCDIEKYRKTLIRSVEAFPLEDMAYVFDDAPTFLLYPPLTSVPERFANGEDLMSFALPCCRCAYDNNGNLWVTASFIASSLTGKCYLPSYYSNEKEFHQVLLSQRHPNGYWGPHLCPYPSCDYLANVDTKHINCSHADSDEFRQLDMTIQIYARKGVIFEYVPTKAVTPWMHAIASTTSKY